MNTVKIDGKNVSVIEPTEIIVTIKNKKTGEIYDNEEALKLANIPQEDIQRDVLVKMPTLDLFAKSK